ncbi:hypothetical protein BpHYR1_034880 [Brachionus plicatilis]|uniref:hAT-like transposase RNase-H fold domain-containing protein n=1 Tax=Brachionus plicatilis TaxID=10195 RepID=A0A3M7SEC1_BRAPC|nr:hypothetical protein BpHYR1_034880 [Brachionus plicatilis]
MPKRCCETDQNFDFIKNAIVDMKDKFLAYWEKIIDEALICHMLDPRFKKSYLEGKVLKKRATDLFKSRFGSYESLNLNSQAETSSDTSTKEKPKTLMEKDDLKGYKHQK